MMTIVFSFRLIAAFFSEVTSGWREQLN